MFREFVKSEHREIAQMSFLLWSINLFHLPKWFNASLNPSYPGSYEQALKHKTYWTQTRNKKKQNKTNHIAEHHQLTKHSLHWDSAKCITYSTDYRQWRAYVRKLVYQLRTNPLNRSQQLPALYKNDLFTTSNITFMMTIHNWHPQISFTDNTMTY